jgi:hypothetical protein
MATQSQWLLAVLSVLVIDGATGAASGDTWVEVTQTVTNNYAVSLSQAVTAGCTLGVSRLTSAAVSLGATLAALFAGSSPSPAFDGNSFETTAFYATTPSGTTYNSSISVAVTGGFTDSAKLTTNGSFTLSVTTGFSLLTQLLAVAAFTQGATVTFSNIGGKHL